MNFKELKKYWSGQPVRELVNEIINDHYNDFCGSYADDESSKRIPYLGWYWRHVNFAELKITIGMGGGLVGFMENNKWDYPERDLTEAEAKKVISYLDRAIARNSAGGQLSETIKERDAILAELKDYIQTLKIDAEAYYATA